MRRWTILLLTTALPAGCALVGYDFDGYKPANTVSGSVSSGGSGGPSASSSSSGSGGVTECPGAGLWTRFETTVSSPESIVHAVDLNGDHLPDVVATSRSGKSVTVLVNQGEGTLTVNNEYSPFAAVDALGGVAIGNFDADMAPDVALTNSVGGTIILLFNHGDAYFTDPLFIAASSAGPTSLAAGDVVGDSNVDLTVACENIVQVLQGAGNGSFIPELSVSPIPPVSDFAVADLDGDGKKDFVVASAPSSSVTVLKSYGSGYISNNYPAVSAPTHLVLADINGDTKLDIITTSSGSTSGTLLVNNGDGSFSPGQAPNFGTPTSGLAVADFNGDGRLDLAASGDGVIMVLVGGGDGSFLAWSKLEGLPKATALAAADMNQDGRIDLVEGSETVAVVSVFYNGCE
jgi:hypothetical protein